MFQRKRIGDILVDAGAISEQQLEDALANKGAARLGDYLTTEGVLTEQQLVQALEIQLGIPQVHLKQYPIKDDIIKLIPKELAKQIYAMPLDRERNRLFVAMADPMDYFAIEELRLATGLQIEPRLATVSDLRQTISKYYDLQQSMEAAMDEVDFEVTDVEEEEEEEDTPMIRLVNQILADAVTQGASDIHFDSQEHEYRIRYRVDGVLRTERVLPKHMQNVIIARIKVMGKLNITENRIPQDGRIKTKVNGRPIDLRLSTLPTVFGEKIVMRILDMGSTLNSVEKLGMSDVHLARFKKMLAAPNGIVLVTGPTGSGKSSTLYAALNSLNTEDVNIITVEDP